MVLLYLVSLLFTLPEIDFKPFLPIFENWGENCKTETNPLLILDFFNFLFIHKFGQCLSIKDLPGKNKTT